MFCVNCGCQLPDVAKFCIRCGSRLTGLPLSHSSTATGTFQPFVSTVPEVTEARIRDEVKLPSVAFVRGRKFVVARDGILPSRCVKCNNLPSEPWLRTTFSWHHPGLYFLLFSPLIYVIVALCVRKRIDLAIPLCDVHKSIRKKRLWIGWALIIMCIPVPVLLAFYFGTDAFDLFAVWMGLCMFIVGLFFLLYASPIRPTYIDKGYAEFKGASGEFLSMLPPDPHRTAAYKAQAQ